MAVVDWLNPCARATALRDAYFKLLAGGAMIEMEFATGNGSGRKIKFAQANITELQKALQQAEGECAALTAPTNAMPRRHAIIGRARRW